MRLSIRAKLILSVTIVFLVGATAVAFFMRQTYETSVQNAANESIRRDAAVFAQIERSDTAKLSAADYALEQCEAYRGMFTSGDRQGLTQMIAPVFAELKKNFDVTHWYFESTAPRSTVFLRAHKPEQFGDVLKRKTYLQAVKNGAPSSGLELGTTAVALRVVRPYFGADGKTLIGYMELGEEVNGFLSGIKNQTGDDVGLLLTKQSMDASGWAAMRKSSGLNNNWNDQASYVLAATTNPAYADGMKFAAAVDSVPDSGQIVGAFSSNGRRDVRGVFPVKDATGQRIGLVFVQHDITAVSTSLMNNMIKVLSAVLGMFAVVLVAVILLMNSLVFGRLDRMIAGMESISTRIAGGEYDVNYQASATHDEIGHFEQFFAQFTTLVAGALRQLSDELSNR